MSKPSESTSKQMASPSDAEDKLPAKVGRRRLVVASLATPVVLTLGARRAQAQSGTASKQASVQGR